MSFLDNPALTRRSMVAFFDLELRGDVGARSWLAGTAIQADVAAGGVKLQTFNGF
jgi:hypothetical protein